MTTQTLQYETLGGVSVRVRAEAVDPGDATLALATGLDTSRGVLLTSNYEVPGRYRRYDLGFQEPPLAIEARGREVTVEALNARGALLLPPVAEALGACSAVRAVREEGQRLAARLVAGGGGFAEEERSRQPSVFSVLRAVRDLFGSAVDPNLGLYGAFGYDLAFQFEPIAPARARQADQRDLVLYLPDTLLVVDHHRETAVRRSYEFCAGGASTEGLPRETQRAPYVAAAPGPRSRDHAPGEYAELVEGARRHFARGDLFEVVPSQTFAEPCASSPSLLFQRLRERNPAPYGFIMNLGASEYLVGASPEMYVRVSGRRVETCPIAGTIARGADPLADAEQIRTILNSAKDESELTMCTDVDRNDKSRICEPGSVRVLARRQIELYSRLIHTVDHVEGTLRPEFDGLDAFLSHTWAVTVTGAPKRAAMAFIEEHERSPRRFYGGAVGVLGFDGHVNTGLTLRTIRIADGTAEVRVGATLLHDSDPAAEEVETEVKAAALLDAIRRPDAPATCASPGGESAGPPRPRVGERLRVLLVDAQDSFVHTLADYFRQTGAAVKTLRAGFPPDDLRRLAPDLVVLSPGPGRPADFGLSRVIAEALAWALPLFGVCLGLQAIAEHFGGQLAQLGEPVHGTASRVHVRGGPLFAGFPEAFVAGRYHSLVAERAALPACLEVNAETASGTVMALQHRSLPIAAVQFHPESILTLGGDLGPRLIENVVASVPGPRTATRPMKRRGSAEELLL